MRGLRAWPRGTRGLFIWAKRRVSRNLFVCGGGGGGGGGAPAGDQLVRGQRSRRARKEAGGYLVLVCVEDKARDRLAADSGYDVVAGDVRHGGAASARRPHPVLAQASHV